MFAPYFSEVRLVRQQLRAFLIAAAFFAVAAVAFPYITQAAATVAGTAQTVVLMATSTINTITFTDDGTTATGTDTYNLRIYVTSTINAVWDESVTAPTFGGTASAKVAASVTYPDNRTMLVDITSNFSTGDTLTIAGVKLAGRSASSTVAALEFSTAGGYATSSASYNVTVDPATLTSTNVEPGSLTASTSTTATVSFTLPGGVNFPATGKVQVLFPTGYDLTGVGAPDASCSGTMDGDFTLATSTHVATITRSGGAAQVSSDGSAETCTIANVRTPASGSTGVYQIKLLNSSNAVIAYDTAITADTIVADSLYSPTLTFSGSLVGEHVTATMTFKPNGGILPNGKIVLVMPTGYRLDGSSGTCSTMDGTFSISGSQTATITRANDGFVQTGPSETCTITNVVNPTTPGVTGTFTLRTTDASDNVIDTTSIDAAFISIGGGGSGVSPTPTSTTPPATTSTPPVTPETPTTPTVPTTPPADESFPPPVLPEGTAVGELVRGSQAGVYYIARDGKRYVFPSETEYRSWYPDFNGVTRINDAVLSALPLGGVVRIRPGTHLVKIVSDPKVYAVAAGGVLRWIESEAVARSLYGELWAQRVRDVDVSLFISYSLGDSVPTAVYPAGSVIRDGTDIWYIAGGTAPSRRRLTPEGLATNRIQDGFILPTTVALPEAGTDLVSAESAVVAPAP